MTFPITLLNILKMRSSSEQSTSALGQDIRNSLRKKYNTIDVPEFPKVRRELSTNEVHEMNGDLREAECEAGLLSTACVDAEVTASSKLLLTSRTSNTSRFGTVRFLAWKKEKSLERQQVRLRLGARKKLISDRNRYCEWSLVAGIVGICITVAEAELTANRYISKEDWTSVALRIAFLISTIILITFLALYHSIEVEITVIDAGAYDWKVAITGQRMLQILIEFVVCAFGPVPGTGYVKWPYLLVDSGLACKYPNDDALKKDSILVDVPLDTILTIPMFLRGYLIGRFMVLHSHQFRDAATRSIAALNRVTVNFAFVLKTMMVERPLSVLLVFAVCYWISISWLFSQCERQTRAELSRSNEYLHSLWFVVITFYSIGYGDVVPNTYCGRALAVTTGIVGACVSATLIAVMSRKLELTRAEKHVNAFMFDSKLEKQRKNTAACILQEMWRIYKSRYMDTQRDDMKIRLHQRRFLMAINDFRRIRQDMQRQAEQSHMLVDIAKVQTDMSETLWSMQQTQKGLLEQVVLLTEGLMNLSRRVDKCYATAADSGAPLVGSASLLSPPPAGGVLSALTSDNGAPPLPPRPSSQQQFLSPPPTVLFTTGSTSSGLDSVVTSLIEKQRRSPVPKRKSIRKQSRFSQGTSNEDDESPLCSSSASRASFARVASFRSTRSLSAATTSQRREAQMRANEKAQSLYAGTPPPLFD